MTNPFVTFILFTPLWPSLSLLILSFHLFLLVLLFTQQITQKSSKTILEHKVCSSSATPNFLFLPWFSSYSIEICSSRMRDACSIIGHYTQNLGMSTIFNSQNQQEMFCYMDFWEAFLQILSQIHASKHLRINSKIWNLKIRQILSKLKCLLGLITFLKKIKFNETSNCKSLNQQSIHIDFKMVSKITSQ